MAGLRNPTNAPVESPAEISLAPARIPAISSKPPAESDAPSRAPVGVPGAPSLAPVLLPTVSTFHPSVVISHFPTLQPVFRNESTSSSGSVKVTKAELTGGAIFGVVLLVVCVVGSIVAFVRRRQLRERFFEEHRKREQDATLMDEDDLRKNYNYNHF